MALTKDIQTHRYGTPGNSTQPINKGLAANATVYRGSFATTRSGVLVAASSPQSTDIVWGLIDKAGPGTADIGAGITGGTSDSEVTVEIATGSFWVSAGTGADALALTDEGSTVYLIDEQTVGKTSNSNTRPVAGQLEKFSDPLNILSGKVAVKVGQPAGSTGGPS